MDNIYLLEYEQIKSHLICRLIHNNADFLDRVPHSRAFEDLELVPCFYEEDEDQISRVSPVLTEWLVIWKIEYDQLIRDAFENMRKIMPHTLKPLESLMQSEMKGSVKSVMLNLLKERFPETQNEILSQLASALAVKIGTRIREESELGPMWVLGNTRWMYGAVSVLYPGVAEEFAERIGSSFFIIPASVHELILLPEKGMESRAFLYEMVASANQRIDNTKYLSDAVYYYDRNNKEIRTL